MRRFLRSLILFFVAILAGFGVWVGILPKLSLELFVDLLPPRGTVEGQIFILGYWFQALKVYFAAIAAALFGFFMVQNKWLRRATLTLPVWAPLVYGLCYLAIQLG